MLPTSLLLNNKSGIILPDAFGFKFEVDNLRTPPPDGEGTMMWIDLFDAEIQIAGRYNGSYKSQWFNVFDKDGINKIGAIAPGTRVKYKVLYYSSGADAGKIAGYYWNGSSWVLISKATTDIGTINRLRYNTIEPSIGFSFGQCTIYNTYIVDEDFSTENPTTGILFSHTFPGATIDESVWQKVVNGSGGTVTPLYPGLYLGRGYGNYTAIRQIGEITV